MKKFSSRSALSSKNFRIYFSGNILSVLGIWVQRLSLGWHAWELSESALVVGFVAAAQYIPLLLLTPFFGVFADQFKPRSSAIIMHVILMLVAFILSFLTFVDVMDVTYLIALSFHHLQQSSYFLSNSAVPGYYRANYISSCFQVHRGKTSFHQ